MGDAPEEPKKPSRVPLALLYMCTCVFMHTWMFYAYMNVCILCMHTYVITCIWISNCINIYVYIFLYTCMYVCMCVCVCMQVCGCMCVSAYVHVYVYVDVHAHIYGIFYRVDVYVYVYMCVRVSMCMCMHVHILICAYMYIFCTYVSILMWSETCKARLGSATLLCQSVSVSLYDDWC